MKKVVAAKPAPAPKVVAPKKPVVVQKPAAPAPPPAHVELVSDEEPAMDMTEDTPEVSDETEGHTSDNDARGAFDHF